MNVTLGFVTFVVIIFLLFCFAVVLILERNTRHIRAHEPSGNGNALTIFESVFLGIVAIALAILAFGAGVPTDDPFTRLVLVGFNLLIPVVMTFRYLYLWNRKLIYTNDEQ